MKWVVFALLTLTNTVGFGAEERSIKVTAMSEVKVAPDEVVLELAVHTRDKQLLTAKRENDKIAAAVLSIAAMHAIPAADVKVTNLDVAPNYGDYGRRQAEPVAYDFTRFIEVRLTDFNKIEPFLSDAFEAELSRVTRLQFRVSNQREHQFEARRLAVTHAREKAEHLTQLTGMKLGLPIHIEEEVEQNWDVGGLGGGIGANLPDSKGNRIAALNPQFAFVNFQKAADQEATDKLTAPGQIIITARVTIEFEMTK